MAERLSCDPEGLHAFAATCGDCAETVGVHQHAAMPEAPQQATVAAVSGMHAATSDVAAALAERIQSLASALSSAADQYMQTDKNSGEALDTTVR
ncbi:MAG: type VII secretion target [Dietzia sp.]|nr:type VII secretion target [Dietzia sp.]